MSIKATVDTTTNELVLRIPMAADPQPSKSGKTLIVATTNGNVKLEGLKVQGKTLTLGLNAYIPKD